MWRSDSQLSPDPQQERSCARSPQSLVFLSFFEQECRDIVARLLQAAEPSLVSGDLSAFGLESAAEPSLVSGDLSAFGLGSAAGFVTSTPLLNSQAGNDAAADTAAARPRSPGFEAAAAAALSPAWGSSRSLRPPAAGPRPARPQALPRTTAQRGAAPQLRCRQGPAAGTPHRSGRHSLSQARASLALQLSKAGKGLGAPGSKLPRPAGAAGAGAHRPPSRRLPAAAPALASRSRLRALGKVATPRRFRGVSTQEQLCNRSQDLRKNDESKEWLDGTISGAGKADQTCVYGESSLWSEVPPGPAPGGKDAGTAEQSAGDQLSQELKHVKSELERVKAELAEKTAQCEAYHQAICSFQAQLRAAGIWKMQK